MTTISSQNVKMYTQEIEQLFGQMGSGSEEFSFINSIFTSAEQLQSEDSSTKATGWQNLANGIMEVVSKLISLLASNEKAAANTEVKKEETKTSQTLQSIAETQTSTETSAEEFYQAVDTHSDTLDGIQKELDTDNEKLAEEQKKVDETLKEIEKLQKELQNNPSFAANILSAIQEQSELLNKSIEAINTIKADIETLSALAATEFATIKAAQITALKAQEQGKQQVEQEMQNLASEGTEVTRTQATGLFNIATGETAEVTAELLSSNPYTAAGAGKVRQVATDQNTAGNTRTTDTIPILTQLSQGIGSLSQNTSLLVQFANTIGSSESSFSNLVGAMNSTLEATITSIGSLPNIETVKENLDQAVETDLETLGIAPKENVSNNNEIAIYAKDDSNNPAGSKANGINPELAEQPKKYEFVTPNVSLSVA